MVLIIFNFFKIIPLSSPEALRYYRYLITVVSCLERYEMHLIARSTLKIEKLSECNHNNLLSIRMSAWLLEGMKCE